jgi:hypothetical protein
MSIVYDHASVRRALRGDDWWQPQGTDRACGPAERAAVMGAMRCVSKMSVDPMCAELAEHRPAAHDRQKLRSVQ